MKKWLLRMAIGSGGLVGVLALGVGVAYGVSVSKQGRTYDVPAASFEIPSDAASIAEGERLYVSRGCGSAECHTESGGGHVLLNDGVIGFIAPSNITIAAQGFDASAWSRAVRHGVRADGHSLIFMPARDYEHMSDHDLALIAAYVRSLPRVGEPQEPCRPALIGRMIDLAGGLDLFPASVVDHAHVNDPDPAPGRSVEYGHDLTQLCTGCHGAHLSGGPIPGAPPELGTPLNLTPDPSGIQGWTEEQFRAVLRTGVRPGGQHIDPHQMPWPALARMTDDEIGAIFMYLQTVPARPMGNR